MAAARSLFVSVCAAFALAALVAPVSRADSNGVPPIEGHWAGKVTSFYWDQSSAGSVHPKKKFTSKVDVNIEQDGTNGEELTYTITFEKPFPVNANSFLSMMILDGFGGNYHVSAKMDDAPALTLSGSSNKSGTHLKLNGSAASTEFTHELKFSLKKQKD